MQPVRADISTIDDAGLMALIGRVYGAADAAGVLNEAVSELYDRYGRLVYSIAYHATGDVQAAEEITQDVFVRACASARSYSADRSNVRSWLASIARNRAIDELRRRSVRAEHMLVDWPEGTDEEGYEGLHRAETPEQEVESRLGQSRLRQVVASLPEDQRRVLALAYYQGLSHSQIAQLLGEPLGTVKSRVRLAMHKLRERLIEAGVVDG